MAKKKKTYEELLEEVVVPEEEQPYEVPVNWVWSNLKHLFDINMGQSPKGEFTTEDSSFTPLVGGPADMGSDFPNVSRFTKKATKLSQEGELIVSVRATIGKTNFADGQYCLGRGVAGLKSDVVDTRLLRHYFSTIQVYLNKVSTGTTFKQISKNNIEEIPFPLPPLNEQKRIADKVERLLSKIDEAKRLIDEARESFELRRAAILDKAFRGELTREWREENSSVDSAAKRLKMIKKERFQVAETKREVSEITEMFDELNTEECINNNDWLYIKANMFCYNINCGGTPSKDISEKGEIPFLKVYNIVNNKVDFSYKPQYIPKEVHKSKLKKSILKPNDVIMNIVGPPLKKIAIIPEEYSEMNMNQAIVRFRPIKYVLPKYLYYCLQYDETLRDVINETRGVVGQSNISVSQSRNLIMPIPSLEEQAEIVSKLEEMIEKEEIVLSLVSDEKNLDELKQSILSKAFRGELGTNDPSEENAIELLKEVLQEQVK